VKGLHESQSHIGASFLDFALGSRDIWAQLNLPWVHYVYVLRNNTQQFMFFEIGQESHYSIQLETL
jgi:hypothetical protein